MAEDRDRHVRRTACEATMQCPLPRCVVARPKSFLPPSEPMLGTLATMTPLQVRIAPLLTAAPVLTGVVPGAPGRLARGHVSLGACVRTIRGWRRDRGCVRASVMLTPRSPHIISSSPHVVRALCEGVIARGSFMV